MNTSRCFHGHSQMSPPGRVGAERANQNYSTAVQPRLRPSSAARLWTWLASYPLQQPEIAACLVHVFGDLLAQRLHRGELDFRPQPLQENQLQLRLGQQFDGMEIQDVALNRE